MVSHRYRIRFAESLEKRLKRIPKRDKEVVMDKIASLAENPRSTECKKLQGRRIPALYRIRCGRYRIVYTIEDATLLVLVVEVGHRREVYRSV